MGCSSSKRASPPSGPVSTSKVQLPSDQIWPPFPQDKLEPLTREELEIAWLKREAERPVEITHVMVADQSTPRSYEDFTKEEKDTMAEEYLRKFRNGVKNANEG